MKFKDYFGALILSTGLVLTSPVVESFMSDTIKLVELNIQNPTIDLSKAILLNSEDFQMKEGDIVNLFYIDGDKGTMITGIRFIKEEMKKFKIAMYPNNYGELFIMLISDDISNMIGSGEFKEYQIKNNPIN